MSFSCFFDHPQPIFYNDKFRESLLTFGEFSVCTGGIWPQPNGMWDGTPGYWDGTQGIAQSIEVDAKDPKVF